MRFRAPDLGNTDILTVIQASPAPMTREQIAAALGLRETTTDGALAVRLRALAEQGCVTSWKALQIRSCHGGFKRRYTVVLYAPGGTLKPHPERTDINYPVAVLEAANAIQDAGLYPSIERIRARIGGDCKRITDARDALIESGSLVLTTEPARPGVKARTDDEEPEDIDPAAPERRRRVVEYSMSGRHNQPIPYYARPQDDRSD